MKYYKNGWNWSNEINQSTYYSLRRKAGAREQISVNNGRIEARRIDV